MISGQKCSPEAELVAGKFENPTLLTTKMKLIQIFLTRSFYCKVNTKALFTQLKILTLHNLHRCNYLTTNEISKDLKLYFYILF